MLYGFLVTLYVLLCLLLILIVLVQKGKSSLGLGALGGGTQMLFGSSGGQDLFQKITWGMGVLLMGGSLVLALMKSSNLQTSRYLGNAPQVAQQAIPQPMSAMERQKAAESIPAPVEKPEPVAQVEVPATPAE